MTKRILLSVLILFASFTLVCFHPGREYPFLYALVAAVALTAANESVRQRENEKNEEVLLERKKRDEEYRDIQHRKLKIEEDRHRMEMEQFELEKSESYAKIDDYIKKRDAKIEQARKRDEMDNSFRREIGQGMIDAMNALKEQMREYIELTRETCPSKANHQLSFDSLQLAEKRGKVLRSEKALIEYVRKFQFESIPGMPLDTEIGPDFLPREKGTTEKYVQWGTKYTFYKAEGGHIYHRHDCQCSVYIPIHACNIPQNFSPCKLCNPKLPDVTWYTDFVQNISFMQKIKDDADRNHQLK